MKKIWKCIPAVLVMLTGIHTVYAEWETVPRIEITGEYDETENRVTAHVQLGEYEDLAGIQFTLDYDEAQLKLADTVVSEDYASASLSDQDGSVIFLWFYSGTPVSGDPQDLVTIVFDVSEDTAEETHMKIKEIIFVSSKLDEKDQGNGELTVRLNTQEQMPAQWEKDPPVKTEEKSQPKTEETEKEHSADQNINSIEKEADTENQETKHAESEETVNAEMEEDTGITMHADNADMEKTDESIKKEEASADENTGTAGFRPGIVMIACAILAFAAIGLLNIAARGKM